jgi:hypothetical protein
MNVDKIDLIVSELNKLEPDLPTDSNKERRRIVTFEYIVESAKFNCINLSTHGFIKKIVRIM